MARTDNTPWIDGGNGLHTRFRQVDDKLVKETSQPDRHLIMEDIQTEKREAPRQNFLDGYKVASIPTNDWERVIKKYPELESHDQELQRKALIKFSNDSEMKKYLFKGA